MGDRSVAVSNEGDGRGTLTNDPSGLLPSLLAFLVVVVTSVKVLRVAAGDLDTALGLVRSMGALDAAVGIVVAGAGPIVVLIALGSALAATTTRGLLRPGLWAVALATAILAFAVGWSWGWLASLLVSFTLAGEVMATRVGSWKTAFLYSLAHPVEVLTPDEISARVSELDRALTTSHERLREAEVQVAAVESRESSLLREAGWDSSLETRSEFLGRLRRNTRWLDALLFLQRCRIPVHRLIDTALDRRPPALASPSLLTRHGAVRRDVASSRGRLAGLEAEAQRLDRDIARVERQLASSRAAQRSSGPTLRSRQLRVLVLVVIASAPLFLYATSSAPWIPAETITMSNGGTVVGYVLDDEPLTVLVEPGRRLEYLVGARVVDRELCSISPAGRYRPCEAEVRLLDQ